MRDVYLFTEGFPFGFGEEFLTAEATELARRSHLTIVTPSVDMPQTKLQQSRFERWILPQGINEISRARKVKLLLRTLFRSYLWKEWKQVLGERTCLKKRLYDTLIYALTAEHARSELQKLPPIPKEALIYSYWTTPTTLALVALYGKTHEIIIRMHGVDLYQDRRSTGRQPYRGFMHTRVRGIYFACEYGKTYYERAFSPPAGLSHLARLGVQKKGEPLPYRKESPFVLYSCSSLHRLKRVEAIADALATLTEVPVHWVHIGSNNDFTKVAAYIEQQLSDNPCITYELLGRLPNVEVHDYLATHRVDAMISLSASEGGCPVSIQEAMAYGVPVIGTNVGGITEMIDGNGVLLSANPSPAEVKAAILQLANADEDTLLALRTCSQARWETLFNAEKTVPDFCERIGL